MKHKYLRKILLAAFALVAMYAGAADVDADAALAQATVFLSSQSHGRLNAANVTLHLAHVEMSTKDAARADFYVFNADEGAGYVIVAGDDRVEAILGYGNGSLDMESLPCNMRWWFDSYKRQIEWLREHPEVQPKEYIKRAAADDDFTVEPMLTCQWNQGEPYDWQCAVYEGRYCLTGCVATAMAQVMYYWKYPEELPELPSYMSFGLQIFLEALPSVKLDWENMLDSYRTSYTSEQAAAVATLMRYCSQACYTDCSPDGSGSGDIDQLLAFKQFGYSRQAVYLDRDDFDSENWRSMVNEELLAGRPIPYAGNDGSGGHAFVIDGYKDGLYHVNWGWGGYYDGYFELDLLDPFSGCAFQYMQGMNAHVCPDDGSSTASEPLYDFEVDGVFYQKNGSEAIVTSRDIEYNSYSGDVEIPREVTYDGVTYRVTEIAKEAFIGCNDLISVKLPFVETIGAYAFTHCLQLREVTLGKSLKRSGNYAFCNSQSIERVNIEDVDAFAAIVFERILSNPIYYGARLYCNGQEVTDLVLTSAAKCVSDYAFYGCKSLKSVTIEDGVTSIGDYAFNKCPNLKKVTIPDGMQYVGYCAFIDCFALTDLEFKGSVGTIGEYAFNTCGLQGDLVFPSTVDTIGWAAFAFCEGIDSLILHDVNVVDTYAFYDCKAMQSVSINGQVGSIKSEVFDGCTALSRIDVIDLSYWLGIDFPSVKSNPLSIAQHLYLDGEEVIELDVPAGVTAVKNYAFAGYDGLTRVNVGNDVVSIGEMAFHKCKNLSELTVGDGVKTIGKQAFGNCTSLKQVTLGRGIESLASKAFNASMVIKELVCKAVTPPVIASKDCFSNTIYKNASLSVPRGSLEAYRQASFWNQFVHMNGVNLVEGDVNGDGEVNIADVNAVIDDVLNCENNPDCDVNGDGLVDVADVNAIIDIILERC